MLDQVVGHLGAIAKRADLFQFEFERVLRPLCLPCLSLPAQQGFRFSGASLLCSYRRGRLIGEGMNLVEILIDALADDPPVI